MYVQPEGLPLRPNAELYRFGDPYCRHFGMLEGYTRGGVAVGDTSQGLGSYVWKAYLKDGNKVMLKRDDLDEEQQLMVKDGVTQLDLTFDQNLRPFLVYVADGLPYYCHFRVADSTYNEVALDPTIKFPRCELDYREFPLASDSDIILGHVNGDKLCYRLQRERFLVEHVVATDPKKTLLWRVGLTQDGRFAYQWR